MDYPRRTECPVLGLRRRRDALIAEEYVDSMRMPHYLASARIGVKTDQAEAC